MKTVFTANKGSYGLEFMEVYDTLDELKRAIVSHTFLFEEKKPEYSEELFRECATKNLFTLHEVQLHDEECIVFGEYDGTSWFGVEKKDRNILSTCKRIEI